MSNCPAMVTAMTAAGAQSGHDEDDRKDKKGPHQTAGEFPPGDLGKGPE